MWPIGVGMWRQWCIGMVLMTKPHAKYQDYSSSGSSQRVETLFIGVLKEEEKKKEKDNQYKLKKAMATPLA